MSNKEVCFGERPICNVIALFYKKNLERNVLVKLNKKKQRKNVKSKYEPFIDFTIIDIVNICGVETYSINTLDSDVIKPILKDYFANKGYLVNDINVNVDINRKIRKKDNVFFENVRVLFTKPDKNDLDLVSNLSDDDISKLNNSSVIFNSREIFKLIKEYFKEFEHRYVDVKYVPKKINENYSFFEEDTILADEEVESFSFKENDDERVDNHYLTITEYNNTEIITEEKLQIILSKIFRASGCELNSFNLYDLNSYFVNKVVKNDESIDHTTDELKLYVNFTKKKDIKALDDEDEEKTLAEETEEQALGVVDEEQTMAEETEKIPEEDEDNLEFVNLNEYFDNGNCFEKLDSEDPDFDEDDYFAELKEEKPKKLSFGSRIKNMFSSMRRR